MAIQMLAAWNGYEQHAVYTLSNAEETRLIGLGLARNYTGSVVPPGVRGDAVVFADNTLGYRDDANGGAASPISTGSGSVAVQNRNSIGGHRYQGGAGGFGPSVLTSRSQSCYIKLEAEAPFSRIRIGIANRATTVASGFNAVAAVTETAADTNQTTRYTPVVGGTSYNSMRSNTQVAGWAPLRYQGGALSSAVIPAAVAGPTTDPDGITTGGVNGTYIESAIYTDWLNLKSIPRADGGTRPLVMLRLFKDGQVNGGFTIFLTGAQPNQSYHSAWQAAKDAGEPFFREFQSTYSQNVDGVGTLTNMPTTTAIGQGGHFVFWIEYDYDVPCRSFLAIGDSITQQGGYGLYAYDSWLCRAIYGKSTPSAPMTLLNSAMSATQSQAYTQIGQQILALGHKPTDIVIPSWSPNDSGGTGGGQNSYQNGARWARILEVIDYARKNNITVWTWTFNQRFTGTQLAALQESNARARAMASAGLVKLLDFDAAIPDMCGPDNTHPSLSSIQTMAAMAQAAF